jgi:hypothetical protein
MFCKRNLILTKALLDASWLVEKNVLQEGTKVIWGDEHDLWCHCGQVCIYL